MSTEMFEGEQRAAVIGVGAHRRAIVKGPGVAHEGAGWAFNLRE